MCSPFVDPLFAQETSASDSPARVIYRESLSLFHSLFPAHTSKAERWCRNLLRPGSPWASDRGRLYRSQELAATAAALGAGWRKWARGTGMHAARSVSPSYVARRRRCLLAHKSTHRMARKSLWILRTVKMSEGADVLLSQTDLPPRSE
jgi:hypothetical protein